ncbi:MAG: beta-lactamase family protein [Acidobacteria bacterium]|nr:beta-lactamase family protein [Acidobacteriota bacterium]
MRVISNFCDFDFIKYILATKRILRHANLRAIEQKAVVKHGRIVKAEGYGLANVELNVPATKETVFEIGSITKQITAAVVMLLVEEGKINTNEKIGRYLPSAPEAWNKVTVRHLLTHTSGVKSYTGLSGFELTKRLKRDEFIKAIGAYPLEFEPGERYIYSNSGYNLLGFIIESVSGKSYWDFLQERIFKPLGMNQTANRDPQFIVPNRADGYEWENGKLVGRDYDLTDVFSAGAIVSTVVDLAKWDAALRGDTFLKKESKAQIWTPVVFNDGKLYPYGFGWNVTEFRGHKLVSHGGQTAGFAANISRYVDDDLTVIVLTNLGDIGLGGMIARGIAKIYLSNISLRVMKAESRADVKLTNLFQNALRSYLEDRLDANSFTNKSRAALTTERAKLNAKRIASYGAIKNFIYVGGENPDKNKIYRYKVETPKRIFLWRFELDENRKIIALVLEEEE